MESSGRDDGAEPAGKPVLRGLRPWMVAELVRAILYTFLAAWVFFVPVILLGLLVSTDIVRDRPLATSLIGVALYAGVAVYMLAPLLAGLGVALGVLSAGLGARDATPRRSLRAGLVAGAVAGALAAPAGDAWLGGVAADLFFGRWFLAAASAGGAALLGGLYLWWTAWMAQERDPPAAPRGTAPSPAPAVPSTRDDRPAGAQGRSTTRCAARQNSGCTALDRGGGGVQDTIVRGGVSPRV